MADFLLKKGQTRPVLSATLTYSDGSTVDLTGSSVVFVMRSLTATVAKINAAAAITNNTSPATVTYTFSTTDSNTAGAYVAEFIVTFPGGATLSFPTDGYLEVTVEEDSVTLSSTGRLVQLGEVKDHLSIPATDRTRDARLMRWIDAATPIVEFITGPILQTTYTEAYDGGGSFISLRHRPIVSVTSVTEYRGNTAYVLTQVASPDLGTIYSYEFESTGRIVRRSAGGGLTSFPPGPESVVVVYVAGQASIPANVKMGTLELIRENYSQTEQGGRPTWGGAQPDDFSQVGVPAFAVSTRVRQLLAPNRRHPSIG